MEEGREKFMTLLKSGRESEARALIESGQCKADGWTVICASFWGTTEMLLWIVQECGAPVDELGLEGLNALHLTFSRGYPDRARILLFQCGANPLIRTEKGHSLFDIYLFGIEYFDFELASYLLRRGVTRNPERKIVWERWYGEYVEMCTTARRKALCFLDATRQAGLPKDVARLVAQAIWRGRVSSAQQCHFKRKRMLHHVLLILLFLAVMVTIIVTTIK